MILKDLLATNPDINLKQLTLFKALYEGGTLFNKYKDTFIIKRAREEAKSLSGGDDYYKERKKRAQYINKVSGVLNWIVSLATANNPKIVSEEESEYWESLNKDANGRGTPFSSLVRQALINQLLFQYPYVEARLEGESIDNDYTMSLLDPLTVLDYENDEDGELLWIKTLTKTNVRKSTYGAADTIQNIVTIYTDTDTYGYVFYGEEGTYKDISNIIIKEGDEVTMSPEYSVSAHEFESLPIYRGNANKNHQVIDRISEPAIALFNAELDLSFSICQAAYPQLWIKVDNKNTVGKLFRSETIAIVLSPTESIGYATPTSDAFKSQFENLERLKKSLLESVQMLSADAGSIDQAGRLSGEAIKELHGPLEGMINTLCYPVRDMFNDCIRGIQNMRGEDFNVEVGDIGNVKITEDDINKLEEIVKEEDKEEDKEEVESVEVEVKEE